MFSYLYKKLPQTLKSKSSLIQFNLELFFIRLFSQKFILEIIKKVENTKN